MKKIQLKLEGKKMLSKEQMKNVIGGSGNRCVFYCCPDGCSASTVSVPMTCSSNEQCQSWGEEHHYTCPPNNYLAALCKS